MCPALLAPLAMLVGCATAKPPMPTVERVDLTRFSGDWFVIAEVAGAGLTRGGAQRAAVTDEAKIGDDASC